MWPLAVHSSGRYLVDGNGTAFVVVGDTPWSLAVNCTNAQIDSYLADRASKGCSAILFNAIERAYSSQSPAYLNVDRVAPFTSMNPVNWVINEAYWQRVDYIVNQCRARGMACFIAPAYTGYGSGSYGWLNDYAGVTDAVLQAYGSALAHRYSQGNVIWVLGGDDANDVEVYGNYGSGTSPNRTKQWQIALGIRSVNANVLITGHTARNGTGPVSGEAYKAWTSGYTGFNFNNVNGHDDIDDAAGLAVAAYGRSGYPFFLIEAGYENTDGGDVSGVVPAIQSVLSGGLAGWFGGHDALWHMGSYTPATGATAVLSSYLSGSWKAHQALGVLLRAYAWWKLRPRTDSTLVTSSKGSGAETICPALADDGSFALVWSPGSSFTVNMAALASTSVRARWWNWDSGYSAIGIFANSGSRPFTPPADYRILLLDAA